MMDDDLYITWKIDLSILRQHHSLSSNNFIRQSNADFHQTNNTGATTALEIEPSETILNIKERFAEKSEIQPYQQRFIFQLQDDRTLADYKSQRWLKIDPNHSLKNE